MHSGLELDGDAIFHEQIEPEHSYFLAAVHRDHWRFLDDRDASLDKIDLHGAPIHGLQESKAQCVVRIVEGADDSSRDS